MFDLVVRGDLVLPDRVLEDGFLAVRDGRSPPSARVRRRKRLKKSMPQAN